MTWRMTSIDIGVHDGADPGARECPSEPEVVPMTRYVIALKRERRQEVSIDWVDSLQGAPGVEITDSTGNRRATVLATADGLHELHRRVGAFCHIEPLIEHRPQD